MTGRIVGNNRQNPTNSDKNDKPENTKYGFSGVKEKTNK